MGNLHLMYLYTISQIRTLIGPESFNHEIKHYTLLSSLFSKIGFKHFVGTLSDFLISFILL